MLTAFTVQNFSSIRDLQTLSLEAGKDDHLDWSNLIIEDKRRVVKTAVIYGANASGKSSVLKAMAWFRSFVLNSSKEGQAGDLIPVQPFLLSSETENAPSYFEIEFHWGEYDYRYGFEVTAEAVKSEWLYQKTGNKRTVKVFTRSGQEFDISGTNFKEAKGLEERTRPNALFLSVCAQFNSEKAAHILEWMGRFRHVSGLTETGFFNFTADRLQEEKYRKQLSDLAAKADFNIQSIRSEREELNEMRLPSGFPFELKKGGVSGKIVQTDIKTTHLKRNAEDEVVGEVEFDLQKDESSGTQKFIALSGPIMHTLEQGSILVVDEFEARLHPKLTQAILDLFHSPVNRKNAQLICVTHDVTLLTPERFRKEQVWFCEKDKTGATDLFSLSEMDSNLVRPTSKFSHQYILGLFGAIPKLTHFQEAVDNATK